MRCVLRRVLLRSRQEALPPLQHGPARSYHARRGHVSPRHFRVPRHLCTHRHRSVDAARQSSSYHNSKSNGSHSLEYKPSHFNQPAPQRKNRKNSSSPRPPSPPTVVNASLLHYGLILRKEEEDYTILYDPVKCGNFYCCGGYGGFVCRACLMQSGWRLGSLIDADSRTAIKTLCSFFQVCNLMSCARV